MVVGAGLLALTGCATQPPPQNWDGLELRPVKGLDAVYLRPGVEFKAYKTVMIDPVVVAFDKDWDPNSAEKDLSRQLGDRDVQRIKDEMAAEFREVLEKEFREGGYTLVEQPVVETLRVMPGLTDVYINAPEKMSPGRTYTFAMDAGRMTLVMELRDGLTGQLLGRIVDRKVGTNTGTMQIANSVTNSADFRRAVESWARQLRNGLDRLNARAG